MREIRSIIIHCSATEEGKDYRAKDIDRWHKDRGFSGIGYHFVVLRNGEIENGRPIEQIGAHAAFHNKYSVGVCYIGGLKNGVPKDTRTTDQKLALSNLIKELKRKFPEAIVIGHRDVNDGKSCPCFDAKKEYK